jgi:hypothetical protein
MTTTRLLVLTEALKEAQIFIAYCEDYGSFSGRDMKRKHGDNPFEGFNNLTRRGRKLSKKIEQALADAGAAQPTTEGQ